MFYHFGYEYVFNRNVEPIRRDLETAALNRLSREELVHLFRGYRNVMFKQSMMANWQLPHVVRTPPGRRCFISVVKTIPGRCVFVLLPGFGKEGGKAYECLMHDRHRRPQEVCRLELAEVSREQRLRDPALKVFARELWGQSGKPFSSLDKAIRRRDRDRTS